MQWIRDPAELAGHFATPPVRIGLDTEFVRERTWWPQLALVQLAIERGGETTILLVDPLVPGMCEALAPVLAAPQVLKVMHSAGEDLVA
ncbi:MAG: ribonuclease D, partial [Luteimonas sp.]